MARAKPTPRTKHRQPNRRPDRCQSTDRNSNQHSTRGIRDARNTRGSTRGDERTQTGKKHCAKKWLCCIPLPQESAKPHRRQPQHVDSQHTRLAASLSARRSSAKTKLDTRGARATVEFRSGTRHHSRGNQRMSLHKTKHSPRVYRITVPWRGRLQGEPTGKRRIFLPGNKRCRDAHYEDLAPGRKKALDMMNNMLRSHSQRVHNAAHHGSDGTTPTETADSRDPQETRDAL